ncbi:hypothetical protein P4597_27660 [Peribacillus simplex]|uniref:hypothetical protein n=1 Tax=Peribacillus simplex TaxID=1478 RepID=UPI002E213664|nr:hypothetical protein [Peribacillus simplex]
MNEKTFQVLWIDFKACNVNEENLTFPQFSKIMKMETVNDAQILTYENIYS